MSQGLVTIVTLVSQSEPVYPGLHVQLAIDSEFKKQFPSFKHFKPHETLKNKNCNLKFIF